MTERARVAGTGTPGVLRPADGVTRPFGREGVARPLEKDGVLRPVDVEVEADGVILPDKENEGVIRPLREEATDDGRDEPTVGADSFVEATNTPQFGGHTKYCFPLTAPLFLPFPAKPPLNSTPAQ